MVHKVLIFTNLICVLFFMYETLPPSKFSAFFASVKNWALEASLNIEYFSLIEPISFQVISNYLLPYASKFLSQLLSKVFKYSKNWQLFLS